MPVHHWVRVNVGIFHDFCHAWVADLARALNDGALPGEFYALIEPFVPDSNPDIWLTAETDMEFYRRKQSSVVVRHVSDDRVVAIVEVVSPGNKSSRHGLWSFVQKAADLLSKGVHLLVLDLQPPGPRNPHGIHAVVWEEIAGQESDTPPEKPLALAAYEAGVGLRAYVVPVAVGEPLPDMPLFLEPGAHVNVPLEATYQAAFAVVPRRWRAVLESPGK